MFSGSVRIHSTVYLYTNNGLLGFFLSSLYTFFYFKMKDEDPKKTIFKDRNRNTR